MSRTKSDNLWMWWQLEGRELAAILLIGFMFGLATGGLIVWAVK